MKMLGFIREKIVYITVHLTIIALGIDALHINSAAG